MKAHECYHCKQWIEAGQEHDCWTTTEAALTRDLSEDLQDAYERLRETAVEFGEQRIYASHHSIMFARKTCYFFVRPKKNFLEVFIFLPRGLKHPMVRRVEESSKTRVANYLRVIHRDEVEAPLTDWLREAFDYNVAPRPSTRSKKPGPPKKKPPRRVPLKATKTATKTKKAPPRKRR